MVHRRNIALGPWLHSIQDSNAIYRVFVEAATSHTDSFDPRYMQVFWHHYSGAAS